MEYPVSESGVSVEPSSTTDVPGPKGVPISVSAGPTFSIQAAHLAITLAAWSSVISAMSVASPL